MLVRMVTVTITLSLFALLLLLCQQSAVVQARRQAPSAKNDMFCGRKDCYSVLGVENTCTAKEIKKAYYKLAQQWHPDKNPSPEAAEVFRDIATAYEVLSDATTRSDYDEIIAHPERYYSNYARYYAYRYRTQKTSLRAVLFGILVACTVMQWYYWRYRYFKIRAQMKKHPHILQKLAAERKKRGEPKLELHNPGPIDDDELYRVIEFKDGWEARLPGWYDIFIFSLFCRWPVALTKWLVSQGRWFWYFTILQHEYGIEEQSILTCRKLGMLPARWADLPEEERQSWIDKKLWIPANFEAEKAKAVRSRKKKKY